MVEYTERMLAAGPTASARDVQADMMRLTLEIVTKTPLRRRHRRALARRRRRDGNTDGQLHRTGSTALIRLPVGYPRPEPRFRRAMKAVESDPLDDHRRPPPAGEDRGDLLSMLLQAQDDEGTARG